MNEDVFLVFGLGFFLFASGFVVYVSHIIRVYSDRKDDKDYERTINERREFGYQTVENSDSPRHKKK